MRQLILEHNWADTVLGALTTWPARLQVIVELMLDSAEPMVIWWGPDHLQIYNDAYAPRVDGKQRNIALGQPAASSWQHGWSTFEPLVEDVIRTATSKTNDEFPFNIERNVRFEEAIGPFR